MSQFIVRVVLHAVAELSHQNYTYLHAAMTNAGFSRKIKTDSREWYHLPPAEYWITGSHTISDVYYMAQTAANTVDKNNGILISECVRIKWEGLKPA